MSAKVSVIVPVYNVEKYLVRCVESIRTQTLKDIEIILVDDGSPDRCPQMCDEYALKDSRIKVVHKQNAGLGMACNSGLEVATGEYVAFCDSDDWLDCDMYETMYNAAIKYHADVVYTGLKRVNDKGEILSYLPHVGELKIVDNPRSSLLLDMIASQPKCKYDREIQVSAKVVLYRNEIIREHGLRFVSERECPSEDLVFNVSYLSQSEKACLLPQYFYNYYTNDQSITTTYKPEKFEKTLHLIDVLESLLYNNGIDKSIIQLRLGRIIFGESRTLSRQIIKSELPEIQKRNLLKNISENDRFLGFVRNYPLRKLPLKHLLPLLMLINNKFELLRFVYKVKG